MTTPLTPAEVIEALCAAQRRVTRALERDDNEAYGDALAHLDRIKAAMVEVLKPCLPFTDNDEAERWRKLEEACRGE